MSKLEFKDELIPVIVQDEDSKEVLMLAYTNKEALDLTITSGKVWFWSRSRKKLWMKGEESGNVQYIRKIMYDCDSDALLYIVKATGPACHTGKRTCFHNELKLFQESNNDIR